MSEFIELLFKVVNATWGTTTAELKGRGRNSNIIYARRFFFELFKERYPMMSLSAQGKILNNDHATVINARKKHANDIELVESYRKKFESCKRQLEGVSKSSKYDLIRNLKLAYEERINIERKILMIEDQIKDIDKKEDY